MPVPIISVEQMRQWERATWSTGRTESEVIARVGKLVAERAQRLTRPADRVLILAGKGHNGDDARQAQPHLTERAVDLLNVVDPQASAAEIQPLLAKAPALVIDGLFGIGINRPLDKHWVRLIECINQSPAPVLSVDVPSGLDADTGEPQGIAIRATLTLTLAAPKAGLIQTRAAPFVGRLEVAPEIGLVACPHRTDWQWTLPEDFLGVPPRRPVNSHKGTFGHPIIIAGSRGYHGAAVLAARGALSARPGLVTVFTLEPVYLPVAAQLQAAMVHPWRPGVPLPESASALLFGPGLAQPDLPADLKAELVLLWQELPLPVVVDASALNWLPRGQVNSKALRVITPHPGEAARMLQAPAADVQADRPTAVRKLSKQWGNCWVVLKGNQTIIGRSKGDVFVNCSGNPELAQGGSGDVLAGLLAGCLAQEALQSDVARTIRYAVWRHGKVADDLSESGRHWTVATLLDMLTA
jgi:ADP-dependent NAD(P)H-hydrate dehydratase / NAD(P)H-hydrate epimerase